MPRFSIVMPTRNRPHFIVRAIGAILSQDFDDWELLVMDGGEPVRALIPTDGRIRYYHMPAHVHRANVGFRYAKGDVLSFQADDDELLPGALAHVARTIDGNEWLIGKMRVNGSICGGAWNPDFLRSVGNDIPLPATFWTRQAYETVGEFDPSLPFTADYDYWMRLGARYTPATTDQVLVEYGVHPGQDSTINHAAMLASSQALRQRAAEGYYEVKN